jgi:ADP-ribose pyrophosphatase YjhB (NUDIX family)
LIQRFNLRVYAIIINEQNEILLSKERRGDVEFTKFPGGGVELGEGILEALHREIKEELNAEIQGAELFFVNDFFQASAFRPDDQIVCFYYSVKLRDISVIQCKPRHPIGSSNHLDFETPTWCSLCTIRPEILTFDLDKVLLMRLLKNN